MQAAWDALERNDFRFAEAAAREALKRSPGDGEALYLLGSTLLFEGRAAEALAPLTEAAERLARRGVAYRLGHCHLALGDFARAEAALRRETRTYPESANAHNTLGVALVGQGRNLPALTAFVAALRADALHAEAANNLGNVLRALGRNAEALPYLQSAVTAQPGLADAHMNLGLVLHALQRYDEAMAAFARVLELEPDKPYALGALVWAELHACAWDEFAAHEDALRAQVRAGVPQSPFAMLAVSDSPAEQRRCAELHVRETLAGAHEPLSDGARPARSRLRVAYLSADFHDHATARCMARLFELHDRGRFEVIGVSYGPDDGSASRARLKLAFDRFVDVIDMSDEQAARQLRELEIDIAVDLKGLTASARPGILAHRPAPVQATYLGFPGSTAAPCIDYVLADEIVIPQDEQRFYAEHVAYVPGTYYPYDASTPIAERTPSRAEAGLPERGSVFCCFNNTWKLSPRLFEVWMRLLAAVPGSVLWLLQPTDIARRNLGVAARARGVDPSRLVFAPRAPHPEHLARHRLADLFLDTLPYNAHTTAGDALWAGLPVLTCRGTTFASRVAASLLSAGGLPELITTSLEEYEARALELARDPAALARLREKLERNRLASPLFDNERACRNIEAAYLRLWEKK
jgi:predicted O-linked N-acetylglucosamine transferase (SPINDLY family)